MSAKIIPSSYMAADTIQFVYGNGLIFSSFYYKNEKDPFCICLNMNQDFIMKN